MVLSGSPAVSHEALCTVPDVVTDGVAMSNVAHVASSDV